MALPEFDTAGRTRIPVRAEGLGVTLSSPSRPSSRSYIVNEEEGEEEQKAAEVRFLKGRVR